MTGLQAHLLSTAAQLRDVIRSSFGFTLPCKRNQDADTVFLLAGLPSAFDIKKTVQENAPNIERFITLPGCGVGSKGYDITFSSSLISSGSGTRVCRLFLA